MSIPQKQLAIVINEQFQPEISKISVPTPGNDEFLIKTKIYSVCKSQIPFEPSNIGSIQGYEMSGTVVRVGRDVTGFQIGDQVSSIFHGAYAPPPFQGAFAEYVVSKPLASFNFGNRLKTSDSSYIEPGPPVTWEAAATLAMALTTAGSTMYCAMGLQKGEDYSKDLIIIWSAGSSIGTVMVQVSKMLGFKDIIAIASESKFEFLQKLGATATFDYHDSDVIEKIKLKFGEDITYGIDTFADSTSVESMYRALSNTKPIHFTDLHNLFPRIEIKEKKSNPSNFYHCSGFFIFGSYFMFGTKFIKPENFDDRLEQFRKDVEPLVNANKIQVVAVKVLDNGLQSMIEATAEVNHDLRSSYEKLVSRAY